MKTIIKDFFVFFLTFLLRDSNDIGESDRRKADIPDKDKERCIVADPGESPLIAGNSTKEIFSLAAVSQDSPA